MSHELQAERYVNNVLLADSRTLMDVPIKISDEILEMKNFYHQKFPEIFKTIFASKSNPTKDLARNSRGRTRIRLNKNGINYIPPGRINSDPPRNLEDLYEIYKYRDQIVESLKQTRFRREFNNFDILFNIFNDTIKESKDNNFIIDNNEKDFLDNDMYRYRIEIKLDNPIIYYNKNDENSIIFYNNATYIRFRNSKIGSLNIVRSSLPNFKQILLNEINERREEILRKFEEKKNKFNEIKNKYNDEIKKHFKNYLLFSEL